MLLTNRDIIEKSDILFGHTAKFNLPGTFANRHESRKFLADRLKNRDRPSVTMVSDLLGSGKTFLVEMVIAEHGLNDVKLLLCGRNKSEVMVKVAKKGPVFIDEWDIKASPRVFNMAMVPIEEFCRDHAHPVVLMGDYTLHSSLVKSRLKDIADIGWVPMEPLSPKFFAEAMRQRIWYAFMDRFGAESTANDVPESEIEVFDKWLLQALVPGWTRTCATFRDVFRTLTQIASTLKANNGHAMIGEVEVVAWLAANPVGDLSSLQSAFIDSVIKALGPAMADGCDVAPWTLSDLRSMAGNVVASMTDEVFSAEVVEPLARNGILSALGIPDVGPGDTYNQWPEPYLPGSRLRLQAAYGLEK
jgi:hypothetical protein